ncbi:MAG: hypothetical protein AAFX09_00765 [Pseudomonadota bacterium]
MKRIVLPLAASLCLSAPVFAGGGEEDAPRRPSNIIEASFTWDEIREPGEDENPYAEFEAPDYNHVDLPQTVAPIVRDGRLVGYAFVMARVRLDESVDIWRVREKAHLLLDALVRTIDDHPVQQIAAGEFDDSDARQAWLDALTSALPEGWVVDVSLLGQDVRMLSG